MISLSLHTAIGAYLSADAAFRAGVTLNAEDEAQNDVLWKAKEAAELSVVEHPCVTIEDVQAKVALALEDENVFDSISECMIDGEHELYLFLRSLLGETPKRGDHPPPVDKSNNGDN
ncbi:hypothetical protein ASF70_18750 [Rhizobium sp. Leaf321]|uniref:hypothetical protein n=1 Tax=Rhizobium sp. Leaf321 TaxID=1736335 RepID=UPI00071626A6|nr:hypothetical protein [Rhizobium sp. Leaf321]KQQ70888.1 hypothetical protein ASF70_18750 [Rhizobium sp. Leaf321]